MCAVLQRMYLKYAYNKLCRVAWLQHCAQCCTVYLYTVTERHWPHLLIVAHCLLFIKTECWKTAQSQLVIEALTQIKMYRTNFVWLKKSRYNMLYLDSTVSKHSHWLSSECCVLRCWWYFSSFRQWKQYYVILKEYELRFFKDQKSASHVSHC